jgi:hypothetical protein
MERILLSIFYLVVISIIMWRFGRPLFLSKENFKKFYEPYVLSAKKIKPDWEPNYSNAKLFYLIGFIISLIISVIFFWIIYIMWI